MTDNWQRSYHVVFGIAVDVGLAIGSDGSQFDRLDENKIYSHSGFFTTKLSIHTDNKVFNTV